MTIRPGVLPDLPCLVHLAEMSGGLPHWTAEDLAAALQNAVEGMRRLTLVAEEGAAACGFAVASLVTAPPAEAELEVIAVAPAARRRGVGTRLLASVMERTRALGAVTLHLEVRSSNEAAIRLYQRAGLREVGRRSRYYVDPVEDAVRMSMTFPGHAQDC